MHKSILILALLLLGSSALAQRTTVSGVVTGPNGQPYTNCQFNVDFVGESTLPGPYTFGGNAAFQQSYSGARCDGTGSFTIQLPANDQILPQPSQWRFQFQSTNGLQGGPYGCMVTVSITGANQDISATIKPACPSIPGPQGTCILIGSTIPCQFLSPFGTPPVVPPVGQSALSFDATGSPVVSINGGPYFPFGGTGTFASLNLPNIFTSTNRFTLGVQIGPLTCSAILASSPPDGTTVYGSDCQQTAPCLSGGTGAFAQRIAGAWSCSAGGGGGGGVPGGASTQVQSNCGGVFCANSGLAYNTSTNNFTLPDGSTWSPSGLFPPSPTGNTNLIVDSSTAQNHSFNFRSLISGQVCLVGGGTGINSVCVGGDTNFGGPPSSNLTAGDASSHFLSMNIFPFASSSTDQLGYTYTNGAVKFSSDLQPLPHCVFCIDRTNNSIHLFGPMYLPNGPGTGASAGATGAVIVSQGTSTPAKWSSDLTGPFTLVGTFGTCGSTPSGSQNGFCFGPGNNAQAWDANISANWQNIVLANNVPAAGITGLIEPAQVDLTSPTGLGGLYTALNAVAQYCVPEWGATGVGPSGCPFNDAADNIVSAAKQLNLATFGIGPGIPNCASTGTTINKLAKYSASAGASCAVIASIADTQGEIGVVTGRSGTTGTAVIAKMGTVQLVMDGPTTVNDWVINSPSVAGDGRDTGSTTCPVTGAQAIGRVQSTNGGAGTYFVELGGCDTTGGGGGGIADPGSNGWLSRTALNTVVSRTFVASTGISISNIDGTGGNPTFAVTTVPAANGGTNTDSSASTGVAQVAAGVWSFSTALANGTTATTQAANSSDTKAATDAYADRVIANPLMASNSTANTVRVATSDFTTTSASLVSITGLSWTLPANTAATYHYDCDLMYQESTGSTAINFGVQDVSLAPTFQILSMTSANANGTFIQVPSTTNSATTTLTLNSMTPTVTTVLTGRLQGTIEQPSGVSSVFQIMGEIASGITLTIKRGSSCTLTVAAN